MAISKDTAMGTPVKLVKIINRPPFVTSKPYRPELRVLGQVGEFSGLLPDANFFLLKVGDFTTIARVLEAELLTALPTPKQERLDAEKALKEWLEK